MLLNTHYIYIYIMIYDFCEVINDKSTWLVSGTETTYLGLGKKCTLS